MNLDHLLIYLEFPSFIHSLVWHLLSHSPNSQNILGWILGQSQELETLYRSSMWRAGTQSLEASLLPSRFYVNSKLESKARVCVQPRNPGMGHRCPSCHLNSRPDICSSFSNSPVILCIFLLLFFRGCIMEFSLTKFIWKFNFWLLNS